MTNDRKARAARAEEARNEAESAARRRRTIVATAIVAAVVLIVGLVWWAVSASRDEDDTTATVVVPSKVIDGGVEFPAPDGVDASPAPVVEVYSDFLCSHCKDFEADGGAYLVEQAEAGTIRYRFVPFVVLDDTEGADHYSSRAASVALCALEQDGPEAFWKVHDALFANQPTQLPIPGNDDLADLAEQAGATGIGTCATDATYQPWVQQRYDEIKAAGKVDSTPTVVIDGEVTQARTAAELAAAIDGAS